MFNAMQDFHKELKNHRGLFRVKRNEQDELVYQGCMLIEEYPQYSYIASITYRFLGLAGKVNAERYDPDTVIPLFLEEPDKFHFIEKVFKINQVTDNDTYLVAKATVKVELDKDMKRALYDLNTVIEAKAPFTSIEMQNRVTLMAVSMFNLK